MLNDTKYHHPWIIGYAPLRLLLLRRYPHTYTLSFLYLQKDHEAVKTSYRQVTREMLAVQREMLEAVARLRHDPGFVECLTRAHEYQLNDSTQ